MNGRADSTKRGVPYSDQPTVPEGRRRHAPGAGTWTPSVPAKPRHHHRRDGAGRVAPADPVADTPFTGSLPVPPAGPAPEFAASHGELPIPVQAPVEQEETTDSIDAVVHTPVGEGTTVRRKKITLTTCERPARQPDDEARVYVAPPPDGLGKFDLGSVPASVTPPKSWRKAAWFASISSGGVVVAMLVAGTVLVGQPPAERQAIEGWPDRHGGVAPLLPHEGYAEDDQSVTDDAAPTSSADDSSSSSGSEEDSGTPAGLRSSSDVDETSTPEQGSGQPTQTTSAGPSTSELRKPPVTPAPMSKAKTRYIPAPPYDADQMGQTSQDFFNTVTEDPAAAYGMTTGELAAEGEEGLRQKYASVAYFQVKHVYIDQNEGYTINTVEVTHADGTTTEETRKLVFGDDEKIADDGQ
ncbi:hypothetical protein DI005_30750 [Prauserella sp. PE36]|uniref:Serine/threonine protein kinase n=1 Tax=Prauserella endophytica TaxID=1592324 RepID=A0ABY2S0Q2_9PSEU|nr:MULTISPECIES: hypothetical protein [Prauserella]RBM13566.1 hypothetical protein DI005_30750 [Prauserella sp. PE36]TKG67685.1 hypothetical protein FCN18_23330 [Prauserella endophytica]